MNNIEHAYLKLLKDILNNGVQKQDRTGTGTLSVFGRQIRHKMSTGFPLLTTKKMPFKTIATELLWFLRGDTNIKFLVDNNCHIWDGDAYKAYHQHWMKQEKNWVENFNKPLSPELIELRDISKEEFINKIKTDAEFAKKWGELGPIYGRQWRNWDAIFDGGVDQIENLINDLKTNPDSRRLMVNAWNVGELDQMTLPPCHYGFQVYTRELSLKERHQLALPIWKEKYGPLADMMVPTNVDNTPYKIPTRAISLMWNQRSVDTFLGLPFNIASYGLLLEIIAKAVNMVPDELIGNLGDTHLYANHVEQAKEQLTRQPYPLPTLNINTEFWPTETGEAGLGEIDAVAVFDGFTDDAYCKCFFEDLQLSNYESHPHIKAPLSN
jgi:thymidylate synthase